MANARDRASINGFCCHNETWDDVLNRDHVRDGHLRAALAERRAARLRTVVRARRLPDSGTDDPAPAPALERPRPLSPARRTDPPRTSAGPNVNE